MKKLILIVVGSITVAGIVTSLTIRHQSEVKMAQSDVILRDQDQQLAHLISEQQQLSNRVQLSHVSAINTPLTELKTLRQQVVHLRSQTNALAKSLKISPPKNAIADAAPEEEHSPEYWEHLHKFQIGKVNDARTLTRAMREYADHHDGRFPSSLDQLDPVKVATLSGTNDFEIIFDGTMEDLRKVPWGEVAVIRERNSWLSPDGKLGRIYGMPSEAIQTVIPDDNNFKTWESKHVMTQFRVKDGTSKIQP